MSKAILKALCAENYLAFADSIAFSTEVDLAKKEFLDNTFLEGETRYNKVSFIYGANGAGKSTFCKILREIQGRISISPLLHVKDRTILRNIGIKEENIAAKPFAYDKEYEEKPVTFGIEIVFDETCYHYEFSILKSEVIKELLTKKKKRTQKLLERSSSKGEDIKVYSDFKRFEPLRNTVRPEALALSMAAFLNIPLALQLVNAISGIQVMSTVSGSAPPRDISHAFSEERIKLYTKILRHADPTIRALSVTSSEEEELSQDVPEDDFEDKKVITKKITVKVDYHHAMFENGRELEERKVLPYHQNESMGTIKLFTMLPYLYNILEEGGVLVIDEIENGLHLSLVKDIITLFKNEESNPHHAQLICTSHQPLLVDGDFRRDQVWIVAKNLIGKAKMYRMSEMKTSRSKINLTTQILKGAFGCNPGAFFENNIFE